MLNRRHIRVKVLQSIFAMHLSKTDNLDKEEKFLLHSIDNMQDLYLIMLSSILEIKKAEANFLELSSKKHLATKEELKPNLKFINNIFFEYLEQSNSLSIALENRKNNIWEVHSDYIQILLSAVKESNIYINYIDAATTSFQDDKQFIIDIFTEIIVPNEKLYEFLEDNKITWIDDIPIVNTQIVKDLNAISAKLKPEDFRVTKLYKDIEDKEFVVNLFRKTVLNLNEFANEFADKTPGWDSDRISTIDQIILKMAICEFIKFPSIPPKVTINEYIEIAKEYATPKSSTFINGILDVLVKEFKENGKMIKIGRGLM